MPRYCVALFLRETVDNVIKERLSINYIKAKNRPEAIGLVIQDDKREFKNMPIIYHLTTEVPR